MISNSIFIFIPPYKGARESTNESWRAAKTRCRNPDNPGYYLYGGRGIAFSTEWDDFEDFIYDMGYRPSLEYSLDRINIEGNYEFGNCKWSTSFEQSRNKRNNRIITYKGKSQCLTDWAIEYNIKPDTLWSRIVTQDLEIEEALSKPFRKERQKSVYEL